jgi:hypothetical protein
MAFNSSMRFLFILTLSISGFLYTAYIYNDTKYLVNSDEITPSKTSNKRLFNIFMTETNVNSEQMTLKQLCSIESNALHNPEATLYIKSLKARINKPSLLIKYPNIEWSLMTIDEIFNETPFKTWSSGDKLTRKDSQLANALRISLVYKYGGFYSNMDQIAIKNFQPLTKYSAIINNRDSNINPESSFFHIKKNHGFLKLVIDDYIKNGNEWTENGPALLQRCIKRYCNTSRLTDLLISDRLSEFNDTVNKCDMNIMPYFIAYPYEWYEAYKMFENNSKFEVSRFIRSYTIHFNSVVSRKFSTAWNDNSIIEFFMAHNCPVVYETVKNNNNINQTAARILF